MDRLKVMGQKLNFWSFWGVFLTPLTPRCSKIRFFPVSRVINIGVYQLCLTFWEVSEKFNGQIKSYGAEIAILSILGLFLTPLPPGLKNQIFPRVKSNQNMCISMLSDFLGSFRKIKWIDQKLCCKKCHFWPFWGVLGRF